MRAGFQIGPLLLEALYMFTTGNKARDTTLNNVKLLPAADTDTGYLADWGPSCLPRSSTTSAR